MKIGDMFQMYQGNSLELMRMNPSSSSGINFVSRTSLDNGVSAQVKKIDGILPFVGGLITVAMGGSVLSSFVQTKPFYTAFHIMVLQPMQDMTLDEKLFYCMCIKKNDYRYNFGRQANKTLKDIEVPDVVPQWVSLAFNDTIQKNIMLMENLVSKNT